MYLGFFSSHSVVSPALTCAELTEAPLGMGRAAEEEGASREKAEGGPSQCVCVCVCWRVEGPPTFVFCMAELEPGARRLVQSQPQGWGALAGGGGSFEELREGEKLPADTKRPEAHKEVIRR